MCFGGGKSKDPYDAYASGDYGGWERSFNALRDERLNTARSGNVDNWDALYDLSGLQGQRNRISGDAQADMNAREAERQFGVKLGQSAIDNAFSQFDDGYYDGYKSDYTGFYYPQVETQFTDAQDKLTAALAGRGLTESTVGADAFADLTEQYNDTRTNIGNEAADAANNLRGEVEKSKSNLYSLNEASADPSAANAQAVGQATALVQAPEYNELGDVFAAVLAPWLNFQSAASNQSGPGYTSPYGKSGSTTATGKGSGRVIT